MEIETNSATATYEGDVVAWASEQARLLREHRFDELDIENVAEEIEDVGKSEQRELASRMAVLLAHLLKWQVQPARRSASWRHTIATQRRRIGRRLARTPSLRQMLSDPDWQAEIWDDAVDQVVNETGLTGHPGACPWPIDDVLVDGWLPG